MSNEYVGRMQVEYEELKAKYEALLRFVMNSDTYASLPHLQKSLTADQLKGMETYLKALGSRIWLSSVECV